MEAHMTKTMIKTMSVTVAAMLAAALMVPAVASADTKDSANCGALVQKYERYLAIGSAKSQPPQGLEAKVAVERCKAGDTSGISAIEKALDNAKIAQPRP
jgi:hypothetical protein